MKLGILAASLSHNGGGVYEAVRRSAQELHRSFLPNLQVFGLQDESSPEASPAWEPIPVSPCTVRGPQSFGYAPDLREKLSNAELDLLHTHGLWMYPSFASLQWAKKWAKPYVITTHGMLDPWAIRRGWWKKCIVATLYEKDHLKGAGCLHALCEAELQAIRAYGLRNPVCVLPFGIDVPESPAPVRKQGKRERTLLFLGRLHPKKNLASLIQAWSILCGGKAGHDSGWILTIAGWEQGDYGLELRALCRQLGLEPTIRFVGPKFGPQKEVILSTADAFILPSLSEGLPISVLEAWSYGLPVLITSQCNLPEGFRAEAAIAIGTDVEGIARGLRVLLAMGEDERVCMGVRGQQLVQKSFSWNAFTSQMHAVYLWLLGGSSKPDCIVEA